MSSGVKIICPISEGFHRGCKRSVSAHGGGVSFCRVSVFDLNTDPGELSANAVDFATHADFAVNSHSTAWDLCSRAFSFMEKQAAILGGAGIMYFVGKNMQKKYSIGRHGAGDKVII